MITQQFDYIAPVTIDEAAAELKKGNAAIIAGGVTIVRQLKKKNLQIARLISLKKMAGLNEIKIAADKITVGAMVTYDELLFHADIKQKCPLLFAGLNAYTDPQIRNQATVGGCMATLKNDLDLSSVALALKATIITTQGNFEVGTRALAPGEIITAIEFPVSTGQSVCAIERITHPATNLSICGISISAKKSVDGILSDCCVALNGASHTATRLVKVENALNGQKSNPETLTKAISALNEEVIDYISDLEGSAEYRKNLTQIVLQKAVNQL